MTSARLSPALVLALLTAALPASAAAQDRWLAADKAAHFGATLGISAGGYAGTALASDRERWRIAGGLGLGLGAAAGKELWDRSHSGTPSWRDFAWSAVGTAAGTAIAWLVDRARTPASGARTATNAPTPSVSFYRSVVAK
ncbi:MAG: hypothetical protein AB7F99_09915 [Vicinamibacterales bacterium]